MALFGNRTKIGALLACIIAAFVYNMYPSIDPPKKEGLIMPRQTTKSIIPKKICVKPGLIALSFGGGISTVNTPKVLDVLKTQKINATFFVSPEWAGTTELNNLLFKKVY
ncbi:hypothetical protein HMI56_001663, partial [Coelomomyces lativittatus]